MSYSFNVTPGKALSVTIPLAFAVSGYTLSIDFDDKGVFSSVNLTKPLTAADGSKSVVVNLTSSEATQVQNCHYRINALKAGVTTVVADGLVEAITASSKEVYVPSRLSEASLKALFAPHSSARRTLPGFYVGAYSSIPRAVTLLDATWTAPSTNVTTHQLAIDCSNLRVVIPFGYSLSSGGLASQAVGEVLTPNNSPVKVAIVVGTRIIPVTFRGSRNATCDAAGFLVSDPIGGIWTKGTQIKIRTLLASITGASVPVSLPSFGPGMSVSNNGYTKNVDNTDAATNPGSLNANDSLWNPGLIGDPIITNPFALGAFTDSIGLGQGDSTNWTSSWITRATNANVPLFRASVGGQYAQGVAAQSNYTLPNFGGCTHVIVALGANDGSSNRTYAQLVADLATIYAGVAAQGVKVFGATITPKTTSTDSWATTTNQAPANAFYTGGANSPRSQVNTWIRSGGGGLLSGYVEVADIVETARDSGIWQAGGTSDGLHPNIALHTAIASNVNLSAIAVI